MLRRFFASLFGRKRRPAAPDAMAAQRGPGLGPGLDLGARGPLMDLRGTPGPAQEAAPGRKPIDLRASARTAPLPSELEVFLAEFSGVTYAELDGRYPPPPGTATAAASTGLLRRSPWRPRFAHTLLHELGRSTQQVEDRTSGEPVQVGWPVPGGPEGFVVPEVDAAFRVPDGTPRTLDHALPGQEVRGERACDALDRLELARLVALLLDEMHRHDLVTTGVTWETFAFTLDPRPALTLVNPERVRRLGGEFLLPVAGGVSEGGPFAPDRQGFAAIASELIGLSADAPVVGLEARSVAHLRRLESRYDGPAASVPPVGEWRAALGLREAVVR